jgi:hypothetical protein
MDNRICASQHGLPPFLAFGKEVAACQQHLRIYGYDQSLFRSRTQHNPYLVAGIRERPVNLATDEASCAGEDYAGHDKPRER